MLVVRLDESLGSPNARMSQRKLKRVRFIERIGEGTIYPTSHAAVQATQLLLDDLLPI